MSFRSNGVDWVHSFKKIQLQVVSFQKWEKRPSAAGFPGVLCTDAEATKTHQT
jgi:hypothetical protein